MNKIANVMSAMGQRSCPTGGLGACPQQVKKGRSPLLRRSFFEEFGTKLHACMKKIPQTTKQQTKLKKGQKMRQTKKTNYTKHKLTILLTIIAITTGCATNNRHKKIALKIIKNNNTILREIKKERSRKSIKPLIKKSPKLANAEKRLMMAINAVIESNETVKNEFKKKQRKEVLNERRER